MSFVLLHLYRHYKFHLLLLLAVFYGFWQLTFMENIMKWDAIDGILPLHYHISECLRNGILPLWNPYQSLGLPIYADPSINAWYPITWLISILHGYDFYAVNFEYLLHIAIAGFGMLSLARALKLGSVTGLLMALSYMFCGLFIGNAQHVTFVISAAWEPLVLASFFTMLNTGKVYDALKAGLYTYLLFTGGYIAFTIIVAYMLMAILLYHVIDNLLQKRRDKLTGLVKQSAVLGVGALILSLPLIISLYKALPFFTRGSALDVEKIMENSFTFKSFISFLFPYAVTAEVPYWGTDLSMSNGYFGLIALLLVLYTPFVKFNPRQVLFLVFALICLAASVGNELPVRRWMFDYIPAMDMFRHPALFRYFAILGFVITFGYTANEVANNFEVHKKKLLAFSAVAAVLVAGVVISKLFTTGEGIIPHAISNSFSAQWPSGMNIDDHIFVHGFFQLLIIAGLFLAVYISPSVRVFTFALIGLVGIEMVISTQLNLPATIAYPIKLSDSQAALDQMPEGFPFTNSKLMIEISDRKPTAAVPGLWTNLNVYTKQTAFDGYNPFKLNQYDKLAQSPLFYPTLNNKLVYLSDVVLPMNKLAQVNLYNPKNLFFDSANYASISKTAFASSPDDVVQITGFNPNEITVQTSTKAPQVITLLQNYFPGWQVYINDQPAQLYTSNYTFISAVLPAGQNTVRFVYSAPAVVAAMLVSCIALLGLLLYFMRGYLPRIISARR